MCDHAGRNGKAKRSYATLDAVLFHAASTRGRYEHDTTGVAVCDECWLWFATTNTGRGDHIATVDGVRVHGMYGHADANAVARTAILGYCRAYGVVPVINRPRNAG